MCQAMHASDDDHTTPANGTTTSSTGAGDGRNTKKSEMAMVDSLISKRLEEAENFEEKRIKDTEFLERLNDRVNEVRLRGSPGSDHTGRIVLHVDL